MFLISVASRYNTSHELLWQYLAILLYNSKDIQFSEDQFRATIPDLEEVYAAIKAVDGEVDPEKLIEEATFKFEDFFIKGLGDRWAKCSWRGHKFQRCHESMFHSIFTPYGRCLIFNAKFNNSEPMIQIMEGEDNGFFAILDVHLNESSGN